ncbi:S-adenosyl-L-methionine-dependent methyltransferase, partial [Trichocladium antarcticum]
STNEQARQEYDSVAPNYNGILGTPMGAIECQLIRHALGDLTGLTVLDLGGGTGLRARDAIDLGATAVDVVDLAPGMLRVAEETEKSVGRNVMRFFEADVGKPLSHLPLRAEGYDVVMANWVLNYADSTDVLDAMLGNITGHLKPGGLFVGVRDANPRSPNYRSGKYGATVQSETPIAGGFKYSVVIHSDPPMQFEGVTLDVLNSGSPELYEKAGLTNVEIVPYERAEVV